MATGIRIIGESGAVQIDELYKNLALIDYQYYSDFFAINPDPGFDNGYLDVTATPNCLVAVRSYGYIWSLGHWGNGAGGSPVYHRLENYGYFGEPTGPVEVYRFDVPPPVPSNGFGLKVCDATGATTFFSGYKYLRVVDTLTFPSLASFRAGRTVVYDTSRKYAVITQQRGSYAPGSNTPWNDYFWTGRYKNVPGGFIFSCLQTGPITYPGQYAYFFIPPVYLIVDVTDF